MHTFLKPRVAQCLNCASPTPDAFCSSCGQEAIDTRVRFRDQVFDFFGEVFSFESRLPRTLWVLFTRPGELTVAYNSGRRVAYVTPLKTYLFASAVFFAISALLASHAQPTAGVEAIMAQLDRPDHGGVPAFFVPAMKAVVRDPNGLGTVFQDLFSRASVVVIPMYALMLRLVYRGRRRYYGEHVVFALHVHAFALLLFAVQSPLSNLLLQRSSPFALLVMVAAEITAAVYVISAARRFYGGRLWVTVLRAGVLGAGYGAAMGLVTLGVVAVMYLRS